MKRYLIILTVFLLFTSCSDKNDDAPEQEQPVASIPQIPAQESQKPVTGVVVDNNGIIYTRINQELSYNKFITIDADGNGKNDFYFSSVLIYHSNESHMYLLASPVSANGGKLQLDDREELVMNGMWAMPLDAGAEIRAATATNVIWSNFMIKGVALDVLDKGAQGKSFNGLWVGKPDKYLAMQIRINGNIHYGWIRISHTNKEERLILTDFAYNNTAAESIKAGQTLK